MGDARRIPRTRHQGQDMCRLHQLARPLDLARQPRLRNYRDGRHLKAAVQVKFFASTIWTFLSLAVLKARLFYSRQETRAWGVL